VWFCIHVWIASKLLVLTYEIVGRSERFHIAPWIHRVTVRVVERTWWRCCHRVAKRTEAETTYTRARVHATLVGALAVKRLAVEKTAGALRERWPIHHKRSMRRRFDRFAHLLLRLKLMLRLRLRWRLLLLLLLLALLLLALLLLGTSFLLLGSVSFARTLSLVPLFRSLSYLVVIICYVVYMNLATFLRRLVGRTPGSLPGRLLLFFLSRFLLLWRTMLVILHGSRVFHRLHRSRSVLLRSYRASSALEVRAVARARLLLVVVVQGDSFGFLIAVLMLEISFSSKRHVFTGC